MYGLADILEQAKPAEIDVYDALALAIMRLTAAKLPLHRLAEELDRRGALPPVTLLDLPSWAVRP